MSPATCEDPQGAIALSAQMWSQPVTTLGPTERAQFLGVFNAAGDAHVERPEFSSSQSLALPV